MTHRSDLPDPAGPVPGSRIRQIAVGAVAVVSLISLGVAMIAYGSLDADESQHLHAAWLVAEGRVPYADFWEHHTPLLHYALAPVTRWFADRPAVYFAGRAIMGLTTSATLLLVYLLGRRLGPGVGAASVVLLAVQFRFLQHSTQIRPDGPALLTWLTTVAMLVGWRERGEAWRLWAAGLALGLTATLTPKAAFVGLGAVGVVLTHPIRSRAVRRLAWLASGSAVPMTALLGWLAYTGGARALRGFWQDVIVANLSFPDFVKQVPVGVEGIGFGLLALAGIVMTFRRYGGGALRHPLHGPLLIPLAVVSVILLLPSTPAVYSYTWLPVVAAGSLYAGHTLTVAVQRRVTGEGSGWRTLVLLAVIGALLAPAVAVGIVVLWHKRENDAEFTRMRRELVYACPGEAVLDSRSLAVFRPAALRYPSLVLGLRIWIARGVVPADDLLADLRLARAPVGVLDARLRKVGEPVTSFIAKHYVTEPDGLLLAGASLSLPGGAGEADVDLLVPGLHHVTMSPGIQAAIDGVDGGASLISLNAGHHRITWTGHPGVLRLTIAPCALRRG